MLESLTDRMSKAVRNLRGLGKLTEENMADALQEVRQALLSADVHFNVVKQFIENIKQKAIGQEVIKSISPGQQIIKIINDQLIHLFGEGSQKLADKRPLRILMVGLHGSGKTTSSVKLAKHLSKENYKPALIACDVYRPAAIDQLETLAKQENFPCHADRTSKDVPKIATAGLKWAKGEEHDLIIFDTAGRLQIDEDLIQELKKLKNKVVPDEIILVADAALGQEAVNVAKHFHEAIQLSGIILTKMDGDARGGAALSMKSVTGVPIKFIGYGEKMDDLETFHPDRMAQRVLGMGDVVSLVQKAKDVMDQEQAAKMAEKLKRADFNFEDFLAQMQQIKKMGPIGNIMKMIPGMSGMKIGDREEGQMKRTEAIIQSMTPQERQQPHVINGSRRRRLADGSGCNVKDVNQLLKQFQQMRKMMKMMKSPKGKRKMQQMAKLSGMGGGMPGMPNMGDMPAGMGDLGGGTDDLLKGLPKF